MDERRTENGPIEGGLANASPRAFIVEARRQAAAVAGSPHEPDDQAFIDAISIDAADWRGISRG
jgi:hypothetical protein